MKQSIDFCAPTISQYLALEFMMRGLVDMSINRSRSLYRIKRGRLINVINMYIDSAIYVKPVAGMIILLHLPGIDRIM